MAHGWIVVQIEGLRDYAAENGLIRLAAALDQARLVALIDTAPGPAAPSIPPDPPQAGR